MSNDPEQADVAYALAQLLAYRRPANLASRCNEAYQWLLTVEHFDIEEKEDVLADFAFLGWSTQLLWGNYLEREEWARRCGKHATAQEAVSDFLALPSNRRTIAIADRFLASGAVRVAYCLDLKSKVDRSPTSAVDSAAEYYEWICGHGAAIATEERIYLSGKAALLAGGASRVLGRRQEARAWLSRARELLSGLEHAEPDLAIVSYNRLALAYDSGNYDVVLRECGTLKRVFERLSMDDYVAKSDFLLAMVLKSTGRISGAESLLMGVGSRSGTADSIALRGLALVNLAELAGAQGRHAEALEYFAEAAPLIARAPWCFSRSNFVGSLGEVLRRAGQGGKALACYRAAIEFAAANDMAATVAYMRVLVAELLLEEGSVAEAQEEILAALPTISAQRMVREGIAAIALLKDSLRRSDLSSSVKRSVRESLGLESEGC